MLIRNLSIGGQRCCMFLRAFSWFSVLNAWVVSTRITASASGDSNTCFIACTVASHPASWPAYVCTVPAAAWMSSFMMEMIALPMILQTTSPIPIGLTPEHLSRAIRQQQINGSKALGSTYDVQIRIYMYIAWLLEGKWRQGDILRCGWRNGHRVMHNLGGFKEIKKNRALNK